ncbi:hypothetical protein [Pedobacter sp.]|uniref:hypothetical protein n=1 Tax=Pedobacter sp. TaxID=1411316 RepID=UPI0031DF8F17
MKKVILFFAFGLFWFSANAQILTYFINKQCKNTWDNTMNAWSGWSKWEETKTGRSSYSIKVSANAVQYNYSYFSWNEKQDKYYTSEETTTYTFLTDITGTAYPLNKNVRITRVLSYSDKDDHDKINTYNYTGVGSVYSKLTLAQLLSGNASGELYLYRDLGTAGKEYYGTLINAKTATVLQQEKEEKEQAEQDRLDEIAEAKAEKKKKEQETYKNLGKAIGILLKKKN